MTNEELIHFREFYSRGEQKMNTNITYQDYETGKVVEDGKRQVTRTPEYIDHAIGCVRDVRDSSENLKQLADQILERSKMLDADIDGIKCFLFNHISNPDKKEVVEPRCLADSLKQALEVLTSCSVACTYIQERLG